MSTTQYNGKEIILNYTNSTTIKILSYITMNKCNKKRKKKRNCNNNLLIK